MLAFTPSPTLSITNFFVVVQLFGPRTEGVVVGSELRSGRAACVRVDHASPKGDRETRVAC